MARVFSGPAATGLAAPEAVSPGGWSMRRGDPGRHGVAVLTRGPLARRAARCTAALEDFDDDHPAAAARARRAMVWRSAGVLIWMLSRATGGSIGGTGAAISSLARAILALQPALASSP